MLMLEQVHVYMQTVVSVHRYNVLIQMYILQMLMSALMEHTIVMATASTQMGHSLVTVTQLSIE